MFGLLEDPGARVCQLGEPARFFCRHIELKWAGEQLQILLKALF